MTFKSAIVLHTGGDEYGKSLFPASIRAMLEGMTERVLEPRGRNEWLGFDVEEDEKDDDNGLEDL